MPSFQRDVQILRATLYALSRHNRPYLIDEVISGRLELPEGAVLSTSTCFEDRQCPITASPRVRTETPEEPDRLNNPVGKGTGGAHRKYDKERRLIPLVRELYQNKPVPPDTVIAQTLAKELGPTANEGYLRKLVPELLKEALGIDR